MILYLDSSALAKLYVSEHGSELVRAAYSVAQHRAISKVGFAELLAALHRRHREGSLNDPEIIKAKNELKRNWAEMIRIDLTDQLNAIAEKMIAKHALRGFDLIHLSSAVLLKDALGTKDFTFACADHRLMEAAAKEGMHELKL